jgi:hypothetical protein
MVKQLLIALTLLTPAELVAKESDAALAKWASYAPKGWVVLDAVEGVLTYKASQDVVLVLEENDPANRITNDGLGQPELNLNPRQLLILTKTKAGYRQIARADNLLPSAADDASPCLADPLLDEGGVSIKNGTLELSLGYWLSCGSYGVTRRTFKFRHQAGRFPLIGAELLSYSRASGMGEEVSINYLTGRMKVTKDLTVIGPEEGEKAPLPQITWRTIPRQRHDLETLNPKVCEDEEDKSNWCGF